MAYITTRDNTKLYVKDWGSGRPVLLLHGWPLSADSWDDQAIAFAAAGFRTIAYDRRGFGRSDQPWGGYDYDTLADDLAAVIAETGAQDAALVGFSMAGGEVARYMSRHHGKHITQAALISSVVPYMLKTADNPHGVDQAALDGIAAGIKHDRAQFFAGMFKDFFGGGPSSPVASPELLEWARSVSLQASLQATLACVTAFGTTDFRPDLAAFTVPTLIIHGTGDRVVPIEATSRAVARAVPHAKLIEYADAPHGLQATHKDKLAHDLLAFLRQ